MPHGVNASLDDAEGGLCNIKCIIERHEISLAWPN